ncbi:MAG: PHP domain-containing protein, partial [Myxococcota bacterium]
MLPPYIELCSRNAFSFLEGASNPEDLVEEAARLGHEVIALADRDGLYGAPRFHAAAARQGLRAIVGAELSQAAGAPLVLLAESREGYRNLARLLTVAQGNAPKGEARVSFDELEEHAGGLTALVAASGSLSRARLDRLQGVYGPDHTALGVARAMDRGMGGENRFAVALAEAARWPVVAWGDVRVARPEGRRLLDAFTCLFHKTSLDRAGRLLLPNGERTLRTPDEMARRFADRPAWLHAGREIAERCAFTFEDLGYRFPTYPTPEGECQDSWLRTLTFAGARERYGDPLP